MKTEENQARFDQAIADMEGRAAAQRQKIADDIAKEKTKVKDEMASIIVLITLGTFIGWGIAKLMGWL